MITRIGIVAGEILSVLEDRGCPAGLEELLISLDEPKDLIKMSLGWLIREGLIVLNERTGLFTLKKTPKIDPDYMSYAINI